MLFNSSDFLVFYPIVTLLFFLLPHKYRWFLLLAASCYFYAFFIPAYILILFFTIFIDYYAGIWIENAEGKRRKMFLWLSIAANVGVLAFFKYYNFFVENVNGLIMGMGGESQVPLLNIILPIGLSFHTFQAMSYTIEVYRGNQKAERHFGIYALYVMFYPQLVAGPIERPQNILHQFHEEKFFSYHNMVNGLRLMLWGLFMKMVVADRLALLADPVFDAPQTFSGTAILLASFLFSFQIYCDFAGYSLIAIGAARTMGFELMTNFRRPYHARSISEFWSRWHISLSTWFRDYLYIPLGGNRVGIPRWYLNLFLVFLISGFWHGAAWTFIAWGGIHGFYLVFGIVTQKWRERLAGALGLSNDTLVGRLLQIATTFVLVMVAWVFFRAENIGDAVYMVSMMPVAIGEMLTALQSEAPYAALGLNFVSGRELLLAFVCITVLEGVQLVMSYNHLVSKFFERPLPVRWAAYYALLLAIMFFGVYGNRQFIYFQF